MITKNDLELQFKRATGFSKEHFPSEYREWVEEQLLEQLNKVQELINILYEVEAEG